MKFYELKNQMAEALLASSGESACREAGRLLCFSAELSAAELIGKLSEEVPDAVIGKAKNVLSRRISGEPPEYIFGKTDFFGMELRVTPDVLIPQPDTEVVCEQALKLLPQNGAVADICCGSGNIALALMKSRGARADMFDISGSALKIAEMNTESMGLSSKARFFRRDVFSDGFFDGCEKYDAIVSNPPYIRTDVIKTLSSDVRREPEIALDGGADGLKFYRRLLDICPKMLKDGGAMVFEIGCDQREDVSSLCKAAGLDFSFFRDYAGLDRGFSARISGKNQASTK